MNKPLVRLAFVGLVIGLIGVFYFGFANSDPAFAVDHSQSIQGNGIKNISIEARGSSIHLYPSDNNQISVHLKGKSAQKNMLFSVSKNGDTAVITIGLKDDHRIHFSLFSFLTDRLDTEVKVPQNMYKNITGHSQAGSIDIEHLAAGHFDLDSSAGSIHGTGLKGAITAHSSAGSIELNQMDGALDLTSSAGSIQVESKAITHDIKARSSAGSVTVVTEQQPISLQLNLQTSAGSINNKLEHVTYTTKEHNHVIGCIGSGGPLLDLQSSAGSVNIQKQ